MSKLLHTVTEFFVHPDLHQDRDMYYRGRILIVMMLTIALLVFLAYVAALVGEIPLDYGSRICLTVSLWIGGLLILARQRGNILFCSIASVLAALVAVIAGISVSGGPMDSPAVQLMVVPPLMAYFFGGLRWGRYAVGVTFLSMVVLYGLHFTGFTFIQCIDSPTEMNLARMLVSFLNLGLISAMAFIYEITAAVLKGERDAEYARYSHLARTDPLTGLANRRNFDALLDERLATGGKVSPPRCFALGYLDLDGFKPINDKYGHAVGDEVLCAVSDRLRAVLRDGDFVGRHGGDEFMLCLDTVEDPAIIDTAAKRILAAIAAPIETSAGAVSVSGSLGFAVYPADSVDIEGLKRSADAAMYEAKREHGTWRLAKKVA